MWGSKLRFRLAVVFVKEHGLAANIVVVDIQQNNLHIVSETLQKRLTDAPWVTCSVLKTNPDGLFDGIKADTLIYFPPIHAKRGTLDMAAVTQVLTGAASAGVVHAIVLSSAEVYGPRPHNIGFLPETRPRSYSGKNAIAQQWIVFEECAEQIFANCKLTILRPAPVLVPGGHGYFSRLFDGRVSVTLPGHDPTMQVLSPDDVIEAICLSVQKSTGGIYNVSPDGVITLRGAFGLAGIKRLMAPKMVQRLFRRRPADQLDSVRYSWTVSNKKIKTDLGFAPQKSSVAALSDFVTHTKPKVVIPQTVKNKAFDDYGLDKAYVETYRRTLFQFLRHVYWRIEYAGIENIPKQGRAVLTGVHRGLMPLDAVTTFLLIVNECQRHPRFLIHPTLIKFPFQFNFMTKLGGMIACQENADYVLEREEILGIYPEGIHGAFTHYRDAYKLGKFGRDEYVKMALRNRAPIVPFVTVGTPEIFPIFVKFNWRWWKRLTLWPCFPIAPPFPLLPVPLPSKWHIRFLEPIHIEKYYSPEAADDPAAIREITTDVRCRMQAALDEMVAKRKHIFWGSIFKEAKG